MNRIYKVVWSKAKNCYTVVSEIAKRHGKGNRARTCAAAFLAAFALTGVMGMSEAQAEDFNNVNTNTLNAKDSLSVGTKAPKGPMPFSVNSTGDFYAAYDKFSVNKDGKVTAATGKIGQVTIDENGKITGVAAGTADTDAVNVGQLNKVVADAAKASDVGNISDIHKDLQNKDGSKTTVVDAVNNLDNKVGDLKYSAVTEGDIKDGDSSTTAIGKLNKKLSGVATVAGQHSSVSTKDANILINDSGTNTAGGKDYQLSLNQNQNLTSVTTGNTKMDTNGVTVVDKDTNTKVTLTGTGLSINGKTYVSEAGLNANGNKVTQVADGKIDKGSTDAVNGGQLYATNQRVEENASNISLLGNSINKLDNRVDKVGAGAAALAALHPLGFDPEDKWDFAAGYGNYSGASAVALGAYYRPNEDTMFSVGGSFGNGENMVNAGVSLKLGQSNHAPTSKEAAMEKKISSLSQEVEELKAAIADLRAAQTKAKDATEKDAQKK